MGINIDGFTITKDEFNCDHYYKPVIFEGDRRLEITCAECRMVLVILYKKYMVFGKRARIINRIKMLGYNYKDVKNNRNEIIRKIKKGVGKKQL